jgi:hypothetical protein
VNATQILWPFSSGKNLFGEEALNRIGSSGKPGGDDVASNLKLLGEASLSFLHLKLFGWTRERMRSGVYLLRYEESIATASHEVFTVVRNDVVVLATDLNFEIVSFPRKKHRFLLKT